MSETPITRIESTAREKSEMFEWLRAIALDNSGAERKAAIALQELVDLSAARRELAQARERALEEAAKRCDSYSDTGREMAAWAKNDSERASSYSLQALAAQSCAESIRARKPSPASGEQNNATGYQHKPQHYPTAPNAVPDDPVAVYSKFFAKRIRDDIPRRLTHSDTVRALAAHYEALGKAEGIPEGMRRAAEICERMQILRDNAWLTQSLPDTSPAACYRAILEAAKETDHDSR